MTAEAWVVIAFFVGSPVAWVLTEWARDSYRLRQMVRNGRSQTYGITGDPDDLVMQLADLTERHRLARELPINPNVTPFPGRKGRTS